MILDVDALVKIVGLDGARAALRASTSITLDDLRATATRASLPLAGASRRAEFIDVVLAPYERRLTLPLEELKRLPQPAIVDYFKKSGCSAAELVLFLERSQIPYRRGLTKTQLIADAAHQISGLGLYEHIAGGQRLTDESPPVSHHEDDVSGVDGDWYGEVGTRLSLRVNGDLLEGTCQVRRGSIESEYELSGRVGKTTDGRQFLTFSVFWEGEHHNAGSVTAWAGYLQELRREELLSTSWILLDAQYDQGRIPTLMGREVFRRRAVRDEEIQRAKRLLDAPYPRKRQRNGV